MNDIWKAISISVITNGSLLGLFIWVFERLFDSYLSKRTESFKQEIELISKKNFYQFSKTYDDQAQVIKEVYADLVDMVGDVGSLVNYYNRQEKYPELFQHFLIPQDSDPIKWDWYLDSLKERNEDIKAKELAKRASTVGRTFIKNKIYFSKHIAEEIDRLIWLLWYIADTFKDVTFRDPYNFEQVIAQEVIETWQKAVIVINELFPELEESFRKHLGVDKIT